MRGEKGGEEVVGEKVGEERVARAPGEVQWGATGRQREEGGLGQGCVVGSRGQKVWRVTAHGFFALPPLGSAVLKPNLKCKHFINIDRHIICT